MLEHAHRHISELDDQDDLERAVFGLVRDRNQSLIQFANHARAAFLKADSHGEPLPDRRKGMIFMKRVKTPLHLEDHVMGETNGSRCFSDLLDAIRMLARGPSSPQSGTYADYDEY
jgi:hypothetical protein